jgi:ribosomal protein S18 acetylase RimI-like enzyme
MLPSKWKTERLRIEDSTLDEVQELQQINDTVPQTRNWMQSQENPNGSMSIVLNEGALPPIANRSKEYFRLQSIRLAKTDKLIGFIGVYHGFPEDDILWINTVTLDPKYQGKGYGPELLESLTANIEQLGCYTRMRSYVPMKNWPSLRLCVKVGLDKMVEIVGDKVHSKEAEAHVLVEKSFART